MAEEWVTESNEMVVMDEPMGQAELPEVKLFGKWSLDEVHVSDISLVDYVAVKNKSAKYLPHSAGRYQVKRFRKATCPIVERLASSMMMHGRNNGKKLMTAVWLLCTGAREAAFRNIKTIAECLADELINAAKGSSNSYAIKKKDELERVAKSNR
ncbi:unnamed protein product [Anisakis simplex]|uniref:40S ribosomal protein S5 (inferred by orthology to a C. elegans protein) n=1 Tax=Anisakis simplex TaxID=6269 RepID=A0A0M3KBD1_ANISI|nr:unnamed protein product [Anisakis simplex]